MTDETFPLPNNWPDITAAWMWDRDPEELTATRAALNVCDGHALVADLRPGDEWWNADAMRWRPAEEAIRTFDPWWTLPVRYREGAPR